jgi:hypothetical protein
MQRKPKANAATGNTTWITSQGERKPIYNLTEEEIYDAISTLDAIIESHETKIARAREKKVLIIQENYTRNTTVVPLTDEEAIQLAYERADKKKIKVKL